MHESMYNVIDGQPMVYYLVVLDNDLSFIIASLFGIILLHMYISMTSALTLCDKINCHFFIMLMLHSHIYCYHLISILISAVFSALILFLNKRLGSLKDLDDI